MCGGIFLVDGPMHLKASGFLPVLSRLGHCQQRRLKKHSDFIQSVSCVPRRKKKMLSTFKKDSFCTLQSEEGTEQSASTRTKLVVVNCPWEQKAFTLWDSGAKAHLKVQGLSFVSRV